MRNYSRECSLVIEILLSVGSEMRVKLSRITSNICFCWLSDMAEYTWAYTGKAMYKNHDQPPLKIELRLNCHSSFDLDVLLPRKPCGYHCGWG